MWLGGKILRNIYAISKARLSLRLAKLRQSVWLNIGALAIVPDLFPDTPQERLVGSSKLDAHEPCSLTVLQQS